MQKIIYTVEINDEFEGLEFLLETLDYVVEDELECKVVRSKLETTAEVVMNGEWEGSEDNGWIPVSIPPENNRHEHGEPIEYNVLLRGGKVATTGCINNDGIWGWMDWCNMKFYPFGEDVRYWQPLPEPLTQSPSSN